jgi:hypothetical protein
MSMMRVLVTVFFGGALLFVRDAGACSCVGPEVALLSPDRVDDAPLNVRVRADVPSYGSSGAPQVVLRVHGGAVVETTSRSIPSGSVTTVELTPKRPLAAQTRYEIAAVDTSRRPSITIFGTFKTGDATDTVAPKLDTLGVVTAHKATNAISSACQASGPWVTLDGVVASDPGRAGAQLGLAIWLGDGAGKVDDTKTPTAIEPLHGSSVQIGRSSICSPRSFPFPQTGQPWLGIALVDEAGNRSATRRVRVDLTNAAGP